MIECEDGDCSARVIDVVRLGDDQALVLEPLTGELHEGERVIARVDRRARRATERNHTATHLLHAALRERLGTHVRQAGSYVGPDKLRFDFTHGAPLSDEDLRWVEDRVNAKILANQPVRALTTTLDEARALGAMALFGEKYGDVVRMVEIGDGDWSRELCGGTHVRITAEIGVFKITQETSSAANVRRIEAITGPLGVELLRRHDRVLRDAAVALRTPPDAVAEVAAATARKRRELEKQLEDGVDRGGRGQVGRRGRDRRRPRGVRDQARSPNPKALPDLADRLKNQLGDPAVVVLGAPGEGRASLLVAATPGAIERGVKAGAVVKVAAAAVGGGGGGRDNMAQAGGRDPEKLPDALAAARAEIERALASPSRLTTARRAAASRSATPPGRSRRRSSPVLRPGTKQGLRSALRRAIASWRPSASSSACRSRSPAATPPRPPRRVRSLTGWRARRPCRWSSTTSVSRRRWLTRRAGARRSTHEPRRSYWTNGCICR